MLETLIKSQSFWIVISVIAGWLLGVGTQWIREILKIRRLKKMIKEELKSLLKQISDKKDIIRQVLQEFEKHEIRYARSVGVINIGYNNHISELYEHYSLIERNCLHYIYDRLNFAEKFYSEYDNECSLAFHTNRDFDDIIYRYKKHFGDLLVSYDDVSDFINSYLEGKPEDVLYMEQNNNDTQTQ